MWHQLPAELRPLGSLALSACLTLVACATNASSPNGRRIHDVGEVDSPPVLQGCSRDQGGSIGLSNPVFVEFEFVVDETGHVEPGSPRVRRQVTGPRSRSSLDDAVDRLRSCSWTPAMLEGQPVRVRRSQVLVLQSDPVPQPFDPAPPAEPPSPPTYEPPSTPTDPGVPSDTVAALTYRRRT